MVWNANIMILVNRDTYTKNDSEQTQSVRRQPMLLLSNNLTYHGNVGKVRNAIICTFVENFKNSRLFVFELH